MGLTERSEGVVGGRRFLAGQGVLIGHGRFVGLQGRFGMERIGGLEPLVSWPSHGTHTWDFLKQHYIINNTASSAYQPNCICSTNFFSLPLHRASAIVDNVFKHSGRVSCACLASFLLFSLYSTTPMTLLSIAEQLTCSHRCD